MTDTVEIVLLVAAAVGAAALVVEFIRRRSRERQERELLEHLTEGDAPAAVAPPPGRIERRLRAAGLAGPPEAYLFATSVLAAVVSLALLQFFPEFPIAALIGVAFACYLPWAAMAEWARRRARRFEQYLTESLDLMGGALYAGSNLTQALRTAGSASEPPVRREFDEVVRRVGLGMPLERAFDRMVTSYPCEGVRLFTQTLVAKQQAGGNLTPVLKSLNETLRDRWRQQRQIQSQLSGARLTGIVGVLLPYLLVPLLAWLEPGWFAVLLGHPLGPPLIFLAVMLQLLGVLWLWRILNREL
jgi:tight adherence protein B